MNQRATDHNLVQRLYKNAQIDRQDRTDTVLILFYNLISILYSRLQFKILSF